MNRYKRLLSNSLTYGLGSILSGSVGFLVIPIYTRIFSPEKYGIIAMLITLSSIFTILMTMGLNGAQSYYFMEAKNKKTFKTEQITTSILQLKIVLGIAMVLIISIFSPVFVNFFFKKPIPNAYIYLVALSTFFAIFVTQHTEIFRLTYRVWNYIFLSLLRIILAVGFILLFICIFNMGIKGYFTGLLAGSFIAMVIGFFATKRYYIYWNKIEHSLWADFLKFGLPLVPGALTWWIMHVSDRWFVMNLMSPYDLGLYAIGAKFVLLISLAVEAFRKAWWPLALDATYKKDSPEFFQKISLWYLILGSIAAIVLTGASPYLVGFIADKRYFEAWKIVGILCWYSIFYGFYLISTVGIFKSKKTYITAIIFGSAALINIILNYFLIPIYGLIGAAIATSLSMMIANVISMLISNRYFYIRWQWGWYITIIVISWTATFKIISVYK